MNNPFTFLLFFLPGVLISGIALRTLFKKDAKPRPFSLLFLVPAIISIVLLGYALLVLTVVGNEGVFSSSASISVLLIAISCSMASFYHSEIEHISFQKIREVVVKIICYGIILIFFISLIVVCIDASVNGFFSFRSKNDAVQIAQKNLKNKKTGIEFKLKSVKSEYCWGSIICYYDVSFTIIDHGKDISNCLVSLGSKDSSFDALEKKYRGPATSDYVYVDDSCKAGLIDFTSTPEGHSSVPTSPEVSSPEDLNGIGITLGYTTGGNDMVINYITPHSPAEQAGLKINDKIISINDQSVRPPMDLDQAMMKIRGKAGTKVILEIIRDGGEQQTFEIIRDRAFT